MMVILMKISGVCLCFILGLKALVWNAHDEIKWVNHHEDLFCVWRSGMCQLSIWQQRVRSLIRYCYAFFCSTVDASYSVWNNLDNLIFSKTEYIIDSKTSFHQVQTWLLPVWGNVDLYKHLPIIVYGQMFIFIILNFEFIPRCYGICYMMLFA